MKDKQDTYQLRDCAPTLLTKTHSASVTRKYKNGFDLLVSGAVIYFTSVVERLNPFSVLIPATYLHSIEEGDKVEIFQNTIILKQKELKRGADITSPQSSAKIDLNLFEENLQLLGRNLSLFGRGEYASVVDLKNHKFACEVNDLFAFKKNDGCKWSEINKRVGHGQGLTPSFDDLISGVLFADRFSGFNSIDEPVEFVQSLNKKTTIQSCQQLKSALKAKMNIGFEKFLESIFCKQIKSSEILKMFNYGHTSGADILSGVWFYLTNKVRILRNI